MKWFFGILGGLTLGLFLWDFYDKKLRKLCPKHKVPLEDGECTVRYGLIYVFPDFRRASSKLFPWANTEVHAGCRIPEEPKKTVKTRFCPTCREIQQKWIKENGETCESD